MSRSWGYSDPGVTDGARVHREVPVVETHFQRDLGRLTAPPPSAPLRSETLDPPVAGGAVAPRIG
jgi:hypothetical protein